VMPRLLDAQDWMWTPCKLATRNLHEKGYALKKVGGKIRLLHRLTYEQVYGPIPDGLLVCHHCDVRNCYEIEHLFLGTCAENMADMTAKGRHANSKKTHCKNGHELREPDKRGERQCRQCHREWMRAFNLARRSTRKEPT